MTLLTAAATPTTHDFEDFGTIAAIAIIPFLMLVISVLTSMQEPSFTALLAELG
jgi:hypothetical protein